LFAQNWEQRGWSGKNMVDQKQMLLLHLWQKNKIK
jgi:hypothetical protein